VGNVKDWARGIDGLKNRSGKCEGPGEGDRRVKEPEWEMRMLWNRHVCVAVKFF